MITVLPSPMTAIEEMTDPAELARAQVYRNRFDLNWAWLKDHATEIYTRHRGKHVVVAGEQEFIGHTAEEVWARVAEAAVSRIRAVSRCRCRSEGPAGRKSLLL